MALACCWLFVAAVTVFDIAFAVANRDTFSLWEANLVARAMGPWWATCYRALSVGFAYQVARRAPAAHGEVLTCVAVSSHVGLAVHYLRGFLG